MSQHDVADRLEPRFRRAWRETADMLDMRGVYDAWRVGNIGKVWAAVPWREFENTLAQRFEVIMLDGLRRGALSAANAVPVSRVKKQDPVESQIGWHSSLDGFGFSFNQTNPRAVAWAQQNAAILALAIVDGSRDALRDIIVRMFQDGIPPRSAARLIQQYVKLNGTNQLALDNYRREVERQNALRQMARDAESAISAQQRAHHIRRTVMTRERVDDLVTRYSERLHRHQAMTIARTEAMRASNEGQAELWYQAQEQGLLEADRVKRKWVLTQDERLCPICAPIPSIEGNVVGLNEQFKLPNGGYIMRPPAHPNCRCTVVLVFADEDGTFRGPDDLPRGWKWEDGRAVRTGKPTKRRTLKPRIPRRPKR